MNEIYYIIEVITHDGRHIEFSRSFNRKNVDLCRDVLKNNKDVKEAWIETYKLQYVDKEIIKSVE